MKNILVITLSLLLLSACINDGVPKVEDPHNPRSAEGVVMKPRDFLDKYCTTKPDNEDCLRVSKAMSLDSGKGTMPKGW